METDESPSSPLVLRPRRQLCLQRSLSVDRHSRTEDSPQRNFLFQSVGRSLVLRSYSFSSLRGSASVKDSRNSEELTSQETVEVEVSQELPDSNEEKEPVQVIKEHSTNGSKSTRRLMFLLSTLIVLLTGNIFFQELKCWWQKNYVLNITAVNEEMHERVMGQDAALEIILTALKEYVDKLVELKDVKRVSQVERINLEPLVLYVYGWYGVGKTFTASLLASQFRKQGLCANYYIAPFHLRGPSAAAKLVESDLACGLNLVILDETDDRSDLVAIMSTLKRRMANEPGLAVVVVSISRGKMPVPWYYATTDAKNLLKVVEKNDPEALVTFRLMTSGTISHFVPYALLHREDVKKCLSRYLLSRKIPSNETLEESILDLIPFWEERGKHLAKAGCKQVVSTANLIIGGHPQW